MNLQKLVNHFIYQTTKKPECCKKLRNPPVTLQDKLSRRQDARQMQYNAWSRHYKIYSGSYLPDEHERLLKKGWRRKKASDAKHVVYQRKSTCQTVRHDDARVSAKGFKPAHWHWLVWWKPYFGKKSKEQFNKKRLYYNIYGEKVSKNNAGHYIKKHEKI